MARGGEQNVKCVSLSVCVAYQRHIIKWQVVKSFSSSIATVSQRRRPDLCNGSESRSDANQRERAKSDKSRERYNKKREHKLIGLQSPLLNCTAITHG